MWTCSNEYWIMCRNKQKCIHCRIRRVGQTMLSYQRWGKLVSKILVKCCETCQIDRRTRSLERHTERRTRTLPTEWPKTQQPFSDLKVCICLYSYVLLVPLLIDAVHVIVDRETWHRWVLTRGQIFLKSAMRATNANEIPEWKSESTVT